MESNISLPVWWKTVLLIIFTALLAELIMYLDHARGLAYVITPAIIFNLWRKEANITWKTSKRLTVICLCAGAVYVMLGQILLLQVISVEGGTPVFDSKIMISVACQMTTATLCH